MRTIVGFTGASGVAYGVEFLRRCPGHKYLIASKWGRRVLHDELGLKAEELRPWVDDIYSDSDLGAPFSSGSNHFDTLVIVPCS
ncbi:MAG: aromatic acid decarboxylase, partial [Thermodesulfobacteriales bacterium]